MRTLIALSLLTAATLLPNLGCIGCGGYAGGGDQVYQRGDASLILCENGGFVVNLAPDQAIEGRYADSSTDTPYSGVATRGSDGQLAFDYTYLDDGSLATPQLGDAPWQRLDLDQAELDHADIQCQDLENRAWWQQP